MKTIGIVGLGIMGGAFARNLLDAEFDVMGFDNDDQAMNSFVEIGGKQCVSPKQLAHQCDAVITSLPSVEAFHEVVSGASGIASAEKAGLVVIETSTLSIADKLLALEDLQAVGIHLLDCPVSGTGAQAVNKDLSLYVSGDQSVAKRCVTVFEGFARLHYFVGEFGNGSKMKFVANLLVHIHNVASAEAMVLGMKAGLDPNIIYNVIKAGAGNSRIFELRAPMMVANDYTDATMKIDIWQKDIKVIREFAESLDCPTPLFTTGIDIYNQALADGQDKLDTASVCKVLERNARLVRSS